jgi:fatty acid desaturase
MPCTLSCPTNVKFFPTNRTAKKRSVECTRIKTMNHEIECKDLIINRPTVFIAKCLVWALMITVGVALLSMQPWWIKAAGVVLSAMAFAHGIELQHQALHSTGTGNRRLDRMLGLLLGLPLLISFHHYQDRHLHHHQHVGSEDDSEFFQFSKEDNNQSWRLTANLLMLPHWVRVTQLIWATFTGASIGRVYNNNNERLIRNDYAVFGVTVLATLALVTVFRPCDAMLMLAFPLAACIHTLVELPEHWGCAKSPSVFKNTRTVYAGTLATWFTNGNNFHVEHHLAPALRPEELRAFHERITSRIAYRNTSYFDLIKDIYNSRKASYA